MNLYRATVRSYDADNKLATIEPVDGMATAIEDVPVLYASANPDDITEGSLILVADLGDGHHVIVGRIS